MSKKKPRSLSKQALLVGMSLILFAWLINNLSAVSDASKLVFNVFRPFIIGAFIAYLLHGPVAALERWFVKSRLLCRICEGFRRGIAIAAVYLAALALTFLLLYIVLPEVVRSIAMLVTLVQPTADVVSTWLTTLLEELNIPPKTVSEIFVSWESVVTSILASMGNIAAGAYKLMVSFFSGALNLSLGVLISIYMLYGRESLGLQFKKALYALCRLTTTADAIVSVSRRSNQIFSIFLYVRILCSILVGVVTYALLAPFGVHYAVLISVVSGAFNLIPIFGPIVGTVVCCLLLIIVSPAQTLWYLVVSLVLQQVEGNVIEPKMMGDRMGLPTLWVLFGVIVGGGFFGVVGMLAGVPVVAVAYSLIQALIESRLQSKSLDFE
jgi:predicted PurR-regulated permease PerM